MRTPTLSTNATMQSLLATIKRRYCKCLSHPADHAPPLWNVPPVMYSEWVSLSMLACRSEETPAITSDATWRPRICFWVTRTDEHGITSCHRQGHSVVVAHGQQDETNKAHKLPLTYSLITNRFIFIHHLSSQIPLILPVIAAADLEGRTVGACRMRVAHFGCGRGSEELPS